MFPSAHCDNPFESLIKKSSSFPPDQNPISKQDDPPCLFNFPSPFFDEHESPLNQIFFQNQLMAANPCSSDHHTDHGNTDPTKRDATKRNILAASKLDEKEGNQPISAPLRRRNLGVIPRRRAGKKDRHSKICTAQGIRDRRMRLSLQVARKFFDLQDMLGYDKASKTIEWLFTKSKRAIKELISEHAQANNISTSEIDAKSESYLSESEEMSEIEENSNKDVKEISTTVPAANVMPSCISPSENDEMRKSPKRASKPNARESREKARARARCRTREKMMVKRLECSAQWYKPNPTDNDNSQKLGSANSPFEGVDQESNSNNNQEKISPYEAAYNSFEQQLADVGTIEKFLGNSSCSSSTSACHISDYHCSAGVSGFTDPSSNFMGYLGNWDLLSNIERANSIHYSVTNQVSLEGNPNSVYSVTTDFP